MKKKLAALLCLVMIGMGTLNVFAADLDMSPRAEACGKCRLGRLLYTYKEDELFLTAGGCSHGLSGIDTGWEIYHYYRVQCTNGSCDAGTGWIHDYKYYKIKCHGE